MKPQWRGSRKTARFHGATGDRVPFRVRRNGGAVGRLPVSPTRADCGKTIMWPQWRGSRKTARFVVTARSTSPRNAAAMEGQSEDCPFLLGFQR